MTRFLIILLLFMTSIAYSQSNVTPKNDGSVPNLTTPFLVNVASGSKIYVTSTGQLFLCITATASSATLTTGSANFRDLGDYNGLENKPAALGYTPENTANKVNYTSTSTIQFPTAAAAKAYTDSVGATKVNVKNPAFSGTATGIGLPVYAFVTGSNATTTGQILTNVTGLSVNITANGVYEFEAVLGVSTTLVTTGTEYGVTSGPGASVTAVITGSYTTIATSTYRVTGLNNASAPFLTSSGQLGGIIIKGILQNGSNAGTLTIQHLKVSSGTSTVFIGSYLKVTQVQ